jgi:hypothetical protein
MERKLRTLTISEKGKLLDVLDRGVKQADAAVEFGISKATVSRIWKLKDSIRQDLASSHASQIPFMDYVHLLFGHKGVKIGNFG